jgi:hypothetical protein
VFKKSKQKTKNHGWYDYTPNKDNWQPNRQKHKVTGFAILTDDCGISILCGPLP